MHGVRDLRLESREIPRPGPGQVLVRTARVGVCASDVHYYTHGRIGRFVVDRPLVLGHEAAGVICELGQGVRRLRVGDRVSLEPGYPCGRCAYCRQGRYNLCAEMTFMATPPVDGAFAEYLAWPEDFAYKIPDQMSLDTAALLEPLAVGIWAARRGGVQPGSSVAVFGAGPIGCTTLQAARAAGATTLIAADLEPFRLDLARQCGATHTVLVGPQDPLEAIAEIAAERGAPPGVDVAFETAGTLATFRSALQAPRPGGVAVLIGLPPDPMVSLDIVQVASREVDIRGVFRYANCYPAALELAATGRVQLEPLITQRFGLSAAGEALDFADRQKRASMKVMVELGSTSG